MLPSFDNHYVDGKNVKPRINILEIRAKETPDNPPIAWLIVERIEENTPDNSRITMHYERFSTTAYQRERHSGTFYGSYSRYHNAVSLTSPSGSSGAVFLDLQGLEGQRIGTYLMNEIVTWAKRWPGARVNPISLLSHQAFNKERRNRFYEKFNIRFNYTDPTHNEGTSLPMFVEDLATVDNWKENITELGIREYIHGFICREYDLKCENRQIDRRIDSLKSELDSARSSPVFWAIKTLWNKYFVFLIYVAFFSLIAVSILSNCST
ncbi:MAG: hypothetical protein H7Z12_07425 [Rhodospirillaceae bacterium]|nr:hypothetical protein [Rhodospirillales bacterium]